MTKRRRRWMLFFMVVSANGEIREADDGERARLF